MEHQPQKKWAGVTGGGSLGQRALVALFRLTNVTVAYVVMALVVPFYMIFARQRMLAIYRYFRQQWNFAPLKSLYKTYVNHFIFGQCMLDRFAMYAGRRDFFEVQVSGNEHFLRLLEGEKGFILASAHVGNFEMGGYLFRQEKKRINALVFGGENQELMRRRAQTLNNVTLHPVQGDMSHIFAINDALSKGEIVSMPCDRNFGSAKSVSCRFLNGSASFPRGAFALAAHFDVPVLTVFTMKVSSTAYRVFVSQLLADAASRQEKIQQLATAYAQELERVVRRYPEQWFNFYDFWN
ncbi:MAG: lysophospholipid acyltransferase family protein [Prevotellaceae bacterium]|jgi:predicted LPLAT superfamily acyltransferase|nr:lysophospholipid acyltransferase family protein [Prevotellaceae bacterium]